MRTRGFLAGAFCIGVGAAMAADTDVVTRPVEGVVPAGSASITASSVTPAQNGFRVDVDQNGVLDINDFRMFQQFFTLGDDRANCDGSTGEPMLTVNDFNCFVNAFREAQAALQSPLSRGLSPANPF